MAAQPSRRPFTVDEYYQMAAAGILKPGDRVELIDGEIIQMAPIGDVHASEVDWLNDLFMRVLAGRVQVRVQNPLRLSDYSEPVPDIMLLRPRSDFYRSGHPTPADVILLVEVSDTTLRYDRGVKLPLYAREGVPEVWIVEIGPDQLTVHRDPSPTGYRNSQVLRRGERISLSAFPDVNLAVDDILG
jgi:Uma2 family endonuclease